MAKFWIKTGTTSQTWKATFKNGSNQLWIGTAYETLNLTNWTAGDYFTEMTDPLGIGEYSCDIPAEVVATAAVTCEAYSGASPLATDAAAFVDLFIDASEIQDGILAISRGVNRVVVPWQVGSISIIKGDSYLNADGTEIEIAEASGSTWPSNLLSAGDYTITFTCTATQKTTNDVSGAAGFTSTGAVVDATHVRLGDWTHAITNGLSIPKGNGTNAYTYTVRATRTVSTGVTAQHTLEEGTLTVGA